MTVGLFVPCYIDQLYPDVARATLDLLERMGYEVIIPEGQTCCGQPMANSGYERITAPVADRMARLFVDCDWVVAPSGSCVHHIRDHYDRFDPTPALEHLRTRTVELCEFLSRKDAPALPGTHFPYKTGLHNSCHGVRGLGLSTPSERMEPHRSLPEQLLSRVTGIELVPLGRPDECCGFGGTFAVKQACLSSVMGRDRLRDHAENGVDVITGTDTSCLMHLEGLARTDRLPLRFLHIAQILNHRAEPVQPGVL
ncbi:MAG: (Fe-S)-binding protein [Balneolaceae bacterium]